MRRWTGLLLAVLPFVWVASPALAERLPVRRFTVADGLPSDRINALLSDSRGYLWIGTGDGLSRFDGYGFVNYDDRQGLPGSIVSAILEARDGDYWIGAGHALCRSSPGFTAANGDGSPSRFTCVELSREGVNVGANVLHEGRDGRLWIGGSDGLYLLEALAARSERDIPAPSFQPLPLPPSGIVSIAEDGGGGLWVGTYYGLIHRLPSGRIVAIRTALGRELQVVHHLHMDRGGRLWVATPRNLFRLDLPLPEAVAAQADLVLEDLARDPSRTGVRGFRKPDSLSILSGYILEQSTGTLRFLSDDLCEVADETLRCTARAGLLPQGGNLRQLAEDRSGALWIGTESSGLVRFTPSGISSFGPEDGLPNQRIRSIFETPEGDLHVLANLDIARWTGARFGAARPNVPREIRSMGWGSHQVYLKDHVGAWWIATAQGLVRFPRISRTEEIASATPVHVYTTKDGLSANEIFRLFEDRRGDIWISVLGGTENPHRWERSTGRIHRFALAGRFAGQAPTAFAEDGAGDLWIGFGIGGLARRRGDRFDFFPPGGSLPEGWVSSLLLDSRGRLWGATTGGGVMVVEDPASSQPRFSTYTTRQGLASNRVFCVAEDLQGRMYLGTTRGVDRLDPVTGRVRHYTVADGLPSAEVQFARRDRQGDIWFGTLSGLAILRPVPDAPDVQPPVLIDLLRVDGEARPVPDLGIAEVAEMTIGPGRRRLEIGFLGLSLHAAEGLRYQHRLLGASEEWGPPTSERSVHFSNLPPGGYRFEVRAVTTGGVASAKPAAVVFAVLPPFWRSWWFLLLAAAAVVSAVVIVHRRRTARLVALERIRTRIATDLHDEVGAGLSEIALMSEVWARGGTGEGGVVTGAPDRIAATSRRLVDAMSDIVWAINPEKDRVFSLSQRMRRFATTVLRNAGVTLTFQSIEESEDRSLDGDGRREMLLAFQEIVTNAVRHARCSAMTVRLEVRGPELVMQVEDNGRGFDPGASGEGTGLSSLRLRAERLAGRCAVRSGPESGTTVTFCVPLRVPHRLRMPRRRRGRTVAPP